MWYLRYVRAESTGLSFCLHLKVNVKSSDSDRLGPSISPFFSRAAEKMPLEETNSNTVTPQFDNEIKAMALKCIGLRMLRHWAPNRIVIFIKAMQDLVFASLFAVFGKKNHTPLFTFALNQNLNFSVKWWQVPWNLTAPIPLTFINSPSFPWCKKHLMPLILCWWQRLRNEISVLYIALWFWPSSSRVRICCSVYNTTMLLFVSRNQKQKKITW